jgi:periplasmic divalent cation tolerance protein
MKSTPTCVCVTTATAEEEQAQTLASLLVEKRLAACVQLSPISSVYRWQGKIESASEVRLVAKTSATLAQSVIDTIQANHPYDVPEIIVTKIVDGSQDYLKWIETETGPVDG